MLVARDLPRRRMAEQASGGPLARAVLGRPVYFVDDDAARDAQAQGALEACRADRGQSELLSVRPHER